MTCPDVQLTEATLDSTRPSDVGHTLPPPPPPHTHTYTPHQNIATPAA